MPAFLSFLVAFLLSLPIFAAQTQTGPRACQAPLSAAVQIGFNFTHVRASPEPGSKCGDQPNITGAAAVIAHYHEASVRSAALDILSEHRRKGASALRVVMWMRAAEDIALDHGPAREDPLALMVTDKGHLPDQYVANAVRFAEDVQESGYRELIIVPATEGRSNPPCRGDNVWGACYDEKFDQVTWSATEQLITAVRHQQLSKMDIIFDIAGESCFTGDGSLLQRNLEHYARYMAAHYLAVFGDNKYTISCGGADAGRTLRELAVTGDWFGQLHPRPALLDVHFYFRTPAEIRQVLVAANRTAGQLGIRLIIGETFADGESLFQEINSLHQKRELGALQEVLVWPVRTSSDCALDISAVLDWIVPALKH